MREDDVRRDEDDVGRGGERERVRRDFLAEECLRWERVSLVRRWARSWGSSEGCSGGL